MYLWAERWLERTGSWSAIEITPAAEREAVAVITHSLTQAPPAVRAN